MKLFDVVNGINSHEGDIDEMVAAYNPWMINSALSMNRETVLFANEMNRCYDLTNRQQFLFYWGVVPKGKRFGKWQKQDETEEDINNIAHVYGVNLRLAEQYLKLLTADQLEIIRTKNMKGGKYGTGGSKGKA
jgi:hypothetical protein